MWNIGFRLLNKAIEEQSTYFFSKICHGKHNGSVLLTTEQYTEQLKQTQILPMAKMYRVTAKIA